MRKIQIAIKYAFDYIFSFLLLVFSSPFLLISILIIRICSPESPVFFKQVRVGYKNKEFTILKLRSMTDERDANRNLLRDEDRLKTWGKIIRRTNLDEIPQIFNVFKGEMSLIGPRPLLPKEMFIMSDEEQMKRQSILPGISGWEAVNEAKAPSRREKVLLDLYYVEHWSLLLDIRIFILTVLVIFGYQRPDDSLRAPKINLELDQHSNDDIKNEIHTEEKSIHI